MNAIFPAVKHYFFPQNVFKCCQKIVVYLFHLFTPSHLDIACQRHARVRWAFGPNTRLSLQDSRLLKTLATSLTDISGQLCSILFYHQRWEDSRPRDHGAFWRRVTVHQRPHWGCRRGRATKVREWPKPCKPHDTSTCSDCEPLRLRENLCVQRASQTSRKTRTRLNNRDRNPPITLYRSDTPDKALAVDLIARWRLSFTVVTYLWLTVLNIRLGYQREHRLTH